MKILRKLLIAVAIVFAAIVLLIFIPTYRDHELRNRANAGVAAAMQVADRIQASAPAFKEEDGARYLSGGPTNLPADVEGIRITKDGVVRVTFKSPDALRGKAVEIRLKGKAGERECVPIGIDYRIMPPSCRP